jgi:phosphatidylglycerol:prolipoprotein diacylglycerol transferase
VSIFAEITYPRINPILLDLGSIKVRWYGVSYIIAFVLAGFVLYDLARRKRWPVDPAKVADVLFWGILGVFIGGRLGYVLFYGISLGYGWGDVLRVWEGGMSFHGGLLGVIVAYWIYCKRTGVFRGDMFDGLALATAPGLFAVRMGNFINAELYGRPWDGAWAMRFPRYESFRHGKLEGIEAWQARYDAGLTENLFTELRHPSQLYEAFAEGLLLFFVLRWLMLRRGVGAGRISAAFLLLYGAMRFGIEFFREPDKGLGLVFLDQFTRGQQLCFGMIVVGLVVLALSRRPNPGRHPAPAEETAPE